MIAPPKQERQMYCIKEMDDGGKKNEALSLVLEIGVLSLRVS